MKKLIIALMGVAISMAMPAKMSAQPQCPNQECPNKECPEMRKGGSEHMRRGKAQMHRGNAMNGNSVVDMRIVKSLGLDSTKVAEVRDLKKRKAQELREMRAASMKDFKAAKQNKAEAEKKDADKKSAKDRKKMAEGMKRNMEKMQAFYKGYRSELRSMLGDEKYIEYLEKKSMQPAQVNRQQRMPERGKQRMNARRKHHNMPQHNS